MDQQQKLRKEIKSLEPWFHNIHLPDGTETAPAHFLGDFPAFKWKQIAPHIPEDLTGKTVLDIGCNAGFYTLELAKRGADVTAIDLDPHYLKQATWVKSQFEHLKGKISFKHQQVYDLAREEKKYDIVWFMGVLYHLRYPLLALDILSQASTDKVILQTLTMPGEDALEVAEDYPLNDRQNMLESGWPKMSFIEKKFNGDPTNWWAPNSSCIEAMFRTCGFKLNAKPMHETFIFVKDAEHPSITDQWNRSEYLSAIGKKWKNDFEKKVKK